MFQLPELDYAYDALAPHISAEIMELHHSKHHQTYTDKLNEALASAPEWQNKSIEEILTHLDKLPDTIKTTVRNNGGGYYNHGLFWKWMSPDGGGQPSGKLAEDLVKQYGSFEDFQDKFSAAATSIFGSGWAWLMPDLSITTTPNQDNPISNTSMAPLLGLDVWEHAYYLDYKNKRPDYIKSWWNVVSWPDVAINYTS